MTLGTSATKRLLSQNCRFIVSSNEKLKYDGGFLNVGLIGQEITTFDSVALNNVNPEKSKVHYSHSSLFIWPHSWCCKYDFFSAPPPFFSPKAILIHMWNTFEIPLSESRNHYHTQVYKEQSLMLFYGSPLLPKRKLLILKPDSLAYLP